MKFHAHSHTIFLGPTGSHAYGTARPGSDLDLRGCCVASMRTRLSLHTKFEQLWQPGRVTRLSHWGKRAALADGCGPSPCAVYRWQHT